MPSDTADFDFVNSIILHLETRNYDTSDNTSSDNWSISTNMNLMRELIKFRKLENWNFINSNSYTYNELVELLNQDRVTPTTELQIGDTLGISFLITNSKAYPYEIIIPIIIN